MFHTEDPQILGATVQRCSDQQFCTPDLQYTYECRSYLTENSVRHHLKDQSGSNIYEK